VGKCGRIKKKKKKKMERGGPPAFPRRKEKTLILHIMGGLMASSLREGDGHCQGEEKKKKRRGKTVGMEAISWRIACGFCEEKGFGN